MKTEVAPRLQVSLVERDRWTWRFVDPEAGIELNSNETYSSRESAAEWARRAYPDVPLADDVELAPSSEAETEE